MDLELTDKAAGITYHVTGALDLFATVTDILERTLGGDGFESNLEAVGDDLVLTFRVVGAVRDGAGNDKPF